MKILFFATLLFLAPFSVHAQCEQDVKNPSGELLCDKLPIDKERFGLDGDQINKMFIYSAAFEKEIDRNDDAVWLSKAAPGKTDPAPPNTALLASRWRLDNTFRALYMDISRRQVYFRDFQSMTGSIKWYGPFDVGMFAE
ncbi:hypothetical protein [Massilia sp. BJB1822]|uniref:hypothetical protein n=1 Tax=Massilia sp. BJB1822 TaxID=2744470 RepID=UPI0015948D50|nr:hypothetical protein [Massilia sp. BJB1822]NVD98886.1 hypothetical protein [Massilia sp. BJB1822]